MIRCERSIHISTYDRPFLVDKNDNKGRFEPTTNKHQWNRWRTAMNDTLCQRLVLSEHENGINNALSGVGLDRARLKRTLTTADMKFRDCVVVNKITQMNAVNMMISRSSRPDSRGYLGVGQFVFYGIPRVALDNKDYKNTFGHRRMNVYIPDDTKIRKYRRHLRWETDESKN